MCMAWMAAAHGCQTDGWQSSGRWGGRPPPDFAKCDRRRRAAAGALSLAGARTGAAITTSPDRGRHGHVPARASGPRPPLSSRKPSPRAQIRPAPTCALAREPDTPIPCHLRLTLACHPLMAACPAKGALRGNPRPGPPSAGQRPAAPAPGLPPDPGRPDLQWHPGFSSALQPPSRRRFGADDLFGAPRPSRRSGQPADPATTIRARLRPAAGDHRTVRRRPTFTSAPASHAPKATASPAPARPLRHAPNATGLSRHPTLAPDRALHAPAGQWQSTPSSICSAGRRPAARRPPDPHSGPGQPRPQGNGDSRSRPASTPSAKRHRALPAPDPHSRPGQPCGPGAMAIHTFLHLLRRAAVRYLDTARPSLRPRPVGHLR